VGRQNRSMGRCEKRQIPEPWQMSRKKRGTPRLSPATVPLLFCDQEGSQQQKREKGCATIISGRKKETPLDPSLQMKSREHRIDFWRKRRKAVITEPRTRGCRPNDAGEKEKDTHVTRTRQWRKEEGKILLGAVGKSPVFWRHIGGIQTLS